MFFEAEAPSNGLGIPVNVTLPPRTLHTQKIVQALAGQPMKRVYFSYNNLRFFNVHTNIKVAEQGIF